MTFRPAVLRAPNGAIVGYFLCRQPHNPSEQPRLPRGILVSIRPLLQRRKLGAANFVSSPSINKDKYLYWTAYTKSYDSTRKSATNQDNVRLRGWEPITETSVGICKRDIAVWLGVNASRHTNTEEIRTKENASENALTSRDSARGRGLQYRCTLQTLRRKAFHC